MKIHAITKTYKFFFRRAPYKRDLVASLMDLITAKFDYNVQKRITTNKALTLGLVGLVCYGTVKKKIACNPRFHRSL